MAKIRVAINGFGRIGRTVMRICYNRASEFEVVAFNDLCDVKTNAHLLKYDSIMGRFAGKVVAQEKAIVIDGREVKVFA